MAVELSDGVWGIRLRTHLASIGQGEHRDLRLAAEAAAEDGEVTWLEDAGGNVTSAIVPAEFAAKALRVIPLV